ncbi:D-alanyl-D-alanine carboxypeptidase [Salinifilum aidingensis]
MRPPRSAGAPAGAAGTPRPRGRSRGLPDAVVAVLLTTLRGRASVSRRRWRAPRRGRAMRTRWNWAVVAGRSPRAAEGSVRAKNGLLSGVSALPGCVAAARGRDPVFAVVLNDFVTPRAPSEAEDALAPRLAAYGGERDRLASPAVSGHRSEVERGEEVRAPVP